MNTLSPGDSSKQSLNRSEGDNVKDTLIIAISGCTRSGKSTLARSMFERLKQKILEMNGNNCDNLSDCSTEKSQVSSRHGQPMSTIELRLFGQDQYFCPKKPIHRETGYENWESTESIDFEQLEAVVNDFLNRSNVQSSYACNKHESCFIFPPVAPCTSSAQELSVPVKKLLILEGFLLFTRPKLIEQCHSLFFLHVDKNICFERRQSTMPVPEDYFEKVIWPSYHLYNGALIDRQVFVHNSYVPICHLEGNRSPDELVQDVYQSIEPLLTKLLQTKI